MEKITIDLLPEEFHAEELKGAKFYKVQTIGVSIILMMIFLTSLTIALRILQSVEISKIKVSLTQAEQKISDLKTNQASLILLKDRLTTINKFLGVPSKQTEMYNLITKLLPPAVSISSISVDRSGDVLILGTALDGESVDKLVNGLISSDSKQNNISQVSIDSLSRGKDGIYRISLKVKPK